MITMHVLGVKPEYRTTPISIWSSFVTVFNKENSMPFYTTSLISSTSTPNTANFQPITLHKIAPNSLYLLGIDKHTGVFGNTLPKNTILEEPISKITFSVPTFNLVCYILQRFHKK